MRLKHIARDHRMVDEFTPRLSTHVNALKHLIQKGNYVEVLDFLQWLLRLSDPPIDPETIQRALARSRAAYRVVGEDTIVPIASVEERQAIESAFTDLAKTEYNGAPCTSSESS